jgi:hypothetical protein
MPRAPPISVMSIMLPTSGYSIRSSATFVSAPVATSCTFSRLQANQELIFPFATSHHNQTTACSGLDQMLPGRHDSRPHLSA